MHRLYANVLNETEKLYRQKKTKVIVVLTVLVPVLSAFLMNSVQQNLGIVLGEGRDFPLIMLSLFTAVLLPFILFMMAADMFSGEAASRTLKNMLVRPIARSKIFVSKVLVIALFILAELGIIWLTSFVTGLFMTSESMLPVIFEGIMAYELSFFPMMVLGLIAVLIAVCVDSSIGAFALSTLVYIVAKLLPYIFPQAAAWSAFTYTDWHMMWIGNAVFTGNLIQVFTLLLSSCIISFTAGWYLFEKKQF